MEVAILFGVIFYGIFSVFSGISTNNLVKDLRRRVENPPMTAFVYMNEEDFENHKAKVVDQTEPVVVWPQYPNLSEYEQRYFSGQWYLVAVDLSQYRLRTEGSYIYCVPIVA